MSVQDNLLNEKNIVLEQPQTETDEHNQMCSFNSDEMEDMCYFRQDEARGDDGPIAKDRSCPGTLKSVEVVEQKENRKQRKRKEACYEQ